MVLPENALYSFPKGYNSLWSMDAAKWVPHPHPTWPDAGCSGRRHSPRIGAASSFFFFFFVPDARQTGLTCAKSVRIGRRNRLIRAEPAYSGQNSKNKKKGAKRTVLPKSSGSLSTQVYQLIWVYAIVVLFWVFFLVNWVLFEFLLLYMWKKFVLYTVEFWVSWNLRESFLNWVGDINYVTCIGVKLCNGSGVVCTFTALICSLWNLKVYLNFSLVWKLLTWGNDTNKRPFWLWYAWLIFCQIDFFCFLSKVEE